MRESELLEGNRFMRGIKKIQDRLFAIVRLYDQLRLAHVTCAVAWRQTLLLSLDLSRLGKAPLKSAQPFFGDQLRSNGPLLRNAAWRSRFDHDYKTSLEYRGESSPTKKSRGKVNSGGRKARSSGKLPESPLRPATLNAST